MKKILKVLITLLLASDLSAQQTVNLCYGSSKVLSANFANNLINPSFSINPGTSTSSVNSFTVQPLITTTYTLFASGFNLQNGLITYSNVITVTVLPQPQTAVTVTQSNCTSTVSAFNLGLSFNPPGIFPNYTCAWSTVPIGLYTSTQTSLTGNIPPGTYSVTIQSSGPCQTYTTVTINPPPQLAVFSINPPLNGTYSVTCNTPTLNLTAVPNTNNYTWTKTGSSSLTGTNAAFTSTQAGTWTVTAQNAVSGCTANTSFVIGQNTITPSSTVSPTLMNIQCNSLAPQNVTLIATPTPIMLHQIYSPQGATFAASSYTALYTPGSVGTFTYSLINLLNGCKTTKTFTVSSAQGFPTFSLISAQNFSLGCSVASIAVISMMNASGTNSLQIPNGGPVSYTLLPPGFSGNVSTGTLSGFNTYSFNVPGTYTAICKDNVTLCETKIPFSVIMNTISPAVSAVVPTQVLNCDLTQVQLSVLDPDPNNSYNWLYPGNPGVLPGNTLQVVSYSTPPSNTLIANYTLSATNNANLCKSATVIPMYLNAYPPQAKIISTYSALTCNSPTTILTNNSTTGIPIGSVFPRSAPVIAYQWFGPSPQDPLQLSTVYIAAVPGNYTMIAKDMNNGCMSSTVISIFDNRYYPILAPSYPYDLCGNLTVSISANVTGNLSPALTYSWMAPANATVSSMISQVLITNYPGLYNLTVSNPANGCSTTAQYTVGICIGLKDPDLGSGTFHCYPNPTNGKFMLKLNSTPQSKTLLEIYNSLGQIIKTENLTDQITECDLSAYPKGLYILRLSSANKAPLNFNLIKN